MIDLEPLNRHATDRERIYIRKLDHRAEETVTSPRSADVGEYLVHLLDRLAHRIADDGLADDSVGKPAVKRVARFARNLLAVYRVEAADVVERRDMVHVRMCQRNGVDF